VNTITYNDKSTMSCQYW